MVKIRQLHCFVHCQIHGTILYPPSIYAQPTLEFDVVFGALFSGEVRWKSNFETSMAEAMVVRGRSKERR